MQYERVDALQNHRLLCFRKKGVIWRNRKYVDQALRLSSGIQSSRSMCDDHPLYLKVLIFCLWCSLSCSARSVYRHGHARRVVREVEGREAFLYPDCRLCLSFRTECKLLIKEPPKSLGGNLQRRALFCCECRHQLDDSLGVHARIADADTRR